VLGDKDPSTLIPMHNLAATLGALGDHAGVRELQDPLAVRCRTAVE